MVARLSGLTTDLAALENALRAAKLDLEAGGPFPGVGNTLKAERDALRRAIETGAIWTTQEPPT